MKASREIKRWTAIARKKIGKKNGVIPSFFFGTYHYGVKGAKDAKRNALQRKPKWGRRYE